MLRLFIATCFVFSLSSIALANGLNANSIGAKAIGMGGAYIGHAPDASAIFWNPGGLAFQKSSGQVTLSTSQYMATYRANNALSGNAFEIEAKNEFYYFIDSFVAYRLNEKMAFGLGIFLPGGLGTAWESADFGIPSDIELFSEVSALSISPAFAYQITDNFSVGLAANVYYATYDFKNPLDAGFAVVQYEEESSGYGFGATLGLMYKFNDKLQTGLTIRTPTTVTLEGDVTDILTFGTDKIDLEREVEFPLWVGWGVAYMPLQELTLAFDLQYTQWSVLDEVPTKYGGSVDMPMVLNWDDALQVRFGFNYQLNDMLALRGGYTYDPAPSPDETHEILFPSMTNNVFSFGLGYSNALFYSNFSAEYLMAKERNVGAVVPGLHLNPTLEMPIYTIAADFGFYF
jgi:long-chain fatty acid transport protein